MRTFLTTLYFLAFFFAVIAVGALMTEGASLNDVYVAIASVAVTGLIYAGRHFYLLRFGRLGLLKPVLWWKPMTAEEKQAEIAISAAGTITTLLSHRARVAASGKGAEN